jgi:hypothetical protein
MGLPISRNQLRVVYVQCPCDQRVRRLWVRTPAPAFTGSLTQRSPHCYTLIEPLCAGSSRSRSSTKVYLTPADILA